MDLRCSYLEAKIIDEVSFEVFNSITVDDEAASSDNKYLSYSLSMHFSGTLFTIMADHATVDNY